MSTIKLKELSKAGYTDDRARSLALEVISRHYKHHTKDAILTLLQQIKETPQQYIDDPVNGKIARAFYTVEKETGYTVHELTDTPAPLAVYGGKGIEATARRQMDMAMHLPVAVQGALMPDAHAGYGLPVGGVLATRNAVIPYAVGVDIGCRMALTITDETESFFHRHSYMMKTTLREHTHFGTDTLPPFRHEHEILDDDRFRSTELLRRLHGKAVRQLGSSGSGNHFVDFGIICLAEDNYLGLPPRQYAAILSHSGSRGLGAGIAEHYTRIATDVCRLPREVRHLAWLDMDTHEGQEYWLGMQLAGDYATACHNRIHHSLLKATGLRAVAQVSNHHNFAWQETLPDGTTGIVHRKGATPAAAGQPGIIPGSMSTPAWLVTGTGEPRALSSAAHGAGRAMSRSRARDHFTVSEMKKHLSGAGVTLLGGSIEEHPAAYKDIERVMQAQTTLVRTEGVFHPRIVRMNKE